MASQNMTEAQKAALEAQQRKEQEQQQKTQKSPAKEDLKGTSWGYYEVESWD